MHHLCIPVDISHLALILLLITLGETTNCRHEIITLLQTLFLFNIKGVTLMLLNGTWSH